jgi:hypothetical protein
VLSEPSSRTIVERYLFSPLYVAPTAAAVWRWWERRRLAYNVTVGAAGLLTTAVAIGCSLLPWTGPNEGPPPGAILFYAMMANLCYTLGAPIDLMLRRTLGDRAGPVAQALFRYGLAFSVGVTLLPIPLLLVSAIVRFFVR